MKTNILLVGGNGFIGKPLAAALREAGHSVGIFGRTRPENLPSAEDEDFFQGDLADLARLNAAMQGRDEMIYLAHETGVSPYLDSDQIAITRNLENFLGAMRTAIDCGVKKVLYFSSGGAVYGRPLVQPVRENCHLHPISAYGVAKAAMEKYLQMCAEIHGVEYLIVRPSNPYGPGQNYLRKQGVIAVFLHRVADGLPLEVWGDGSATKDYLFIDDLTEAVIQLMQTGYRNRVFNIGSGVGTSLQKIIAEIGEVTGKIPAVTYKSSQKSDVSSFVLDCQALAAETKWKPATSLRLGIQKTLEWILSQPR